MILVYSLLRFALMIVMVRIALEWLAKEWHTLTSAPVTFGALVLVSIATAWVLLKLLYGGIIDNLKSDKESLENRLKAKDEDLSRQKSEYDEKIKTLEERLKAKDEELRQQQDKDKKTTKTEQLPIEQVRVLELIAAFEIYNPTQPNQFPPECSVDEVVNRLGFEYGQVNEVFRQLRRAGFVCSLWEGQATFPNLDRPINEEKPVRLTAEGRAYLESRRNVKRIDGFVQSEIKDFLE